MHCLILGVHYILSNQDMNLRQIEAGLAWHYKKYQNEQTQSDRELYSEAEITAREAKRGLWRERYRAATELPFCEVDISRGLSLAAGAVGARRRAGSAGGAPGDDSGDVLGDAATGGSWILPSVLITKLRPHLHLTRIPCHWSGTSLRNPHSQTTCIVMMGTPESPDQLES